VSVKYQNLDDSARLCDSGALGYAKITGILFIVDIHSTLVKFSLNTVSHRTINFINDFAQICLEAKFHYAI